MSSRNPSPVAKDRRDRERDRGAAKAVFVKDRKTWMDEGRSSLRGDGPRYMNSVFRGSLPRILGDINVGTKN